MTIGDTTAKLSSHKKRIHLRENQWGCDKPVCRLKAESPTFAACVVIFFRDGGKIRTLLVFGKPLRTCEAIRTWSQHWDLQDGGVFASAGIQCEESVSPSYSGSPGTENIKFWKTMVDFRITFTPCIGAVRNREETRRNTQAKTLPDPVGPCFNTPTKCKLIFRIHYKIQESNFSITL